MKRYGLYLILPALFILLSSLLFFLTYANVKEKVIEDLDAIAKRYVETIRIGKEGYAWVVSRSGIVLSCPVADHIGKSVFEINRDSPEIVALAKRMTAGEEGIVAYEEERLGGKIVPRMIKYAVFRPIQAGDSFWSIPVETPEREALGALDGFRNRFILIAVLFAAGIGFLLYVVFRTGIMAREIERRRKTEETLRATTKELDNYFTSSLDLLCIADTDGYFRRLNPEWEKTLGYPLAELEGKRFRDFVHPEDRESTMNAFGELAQEREVLNFVNRYRHRDGSYRWIEWRSYVTGKKIYAVARDITKGKRAEEEKAVIAEIGRVISSSLDIESVYERFAAATKRLVPFDRLAITCIDPQRNLAYTEYAHGTPVAGRQPGDLFPVGGSMTNEVIQKRRGLIVQIDSVDEIVRTHPGVTATFRAGLLSAMSVPLISRDEIIGVLHFRARQPHFYGEGDLQLAEQIGAQIAGAIANARLFSKLQEAERSLRESEARLADILFSIADWVWEVDEKGVYTYSSEKGADLLGVSRDEIIGKKPFDLMPPEEAERVKEIFDAIAARKAPIKDIENWKIREDGERVCLLTNGVPVLDEAGNLKGYRGADKDITRRKRMEEEKLSLEKRLQHAEKMEALGHLAGGVAHDLNNVLGVLVGYSELLLMEMPEGHPHRGHVSHILQAGQKGAAIIQDLLTLARRGVADFSVVNLNEIVSEYLRSPEFADLKARHPRAAFATGLEATLLNILGSPVHLYNTVMNLVSNAVEALPGAGEVTIGTENRYLDRPVHGYESIREGDYVVLTVADTGEGIAPEVLGRIFEPFYSKKVLGRSGTGLGLTVVWGTMKDHRGAIDVRSESGKGTVFTLYFPVTQEAPVKDGKTIPQEAFRGQGETILVVDDVKEQRELAVAILTRLGYRVDAVAGGEEALAYLKDRRADLVVLDMIMDPGMDGLETYRKILEIAPGQKAVIVSGFSETGKVRRAQELGAGAYVKKPYVLEKIGKAIRDELGGTRGR